MRAAALAATCLLAGAAAGADRIVLQSGGVIVADSWSYDGDQIRIESAGGVMSLPRSLVVRVEPEGARPASPPTGKGEPAPRRVGSVPAGGGAAGVRAKIEEAYRAFESRDYDAAVRLFHEVLQADPGASAARAGYVAAEMALGRDPMALAAVLDGLARDPASADLQELLGDLRDREERVDDALVAWREAFRLAPNDRRREKIVKAEREQATGRDYAFSAAAHFNVRYDDEVDPDLAAAVSDELEDRFRDLSATFRFAPSQPINVILYPKRSFYEVTQADRDVGGLFDGKIRVPLGGLKRLDPPARAVLVHELTHAFVHAKTRGNCPRWLHEGLAQLSEPRALSRADLAAVRRKLSEGDPSDWPQRAFSYPAALSFVKFLEADRGVDGLVRVLDRLGDGTSAERAIESEFGDRWASLCARWLESLRADARP